MKNRARHLFSVLIPVLLLSIPAWPQTTTGPVILTVAGGGLGGIPATSTGIGSVQGIAVDHMGNLFISDAANYVVRKVDSNGNMTIVAGNGGSPLDFFGNCPTCVPSKAGDGGPAVNTELLSPLVVAVDGIANLFISDSGTLIRRVDSNGIISTAAGTGISGFGGDGGPAASAQIAVGDMAADGVGNLYFTNFISNTPTFGCAAVVRKVNTLGIINTVAGTGTCGFSGDGGPAVNAEINAAAIAVDSSGNIYIADASDARIRRVNTTGVISTIAGTGTCGFSGDGGAAISAQICPFSIAVDSNGNIFFLDGNGVSEHVRKIDTSGVITTVAGDGTIGLSGDGGPATNAEINAGFIAADLVGDLFLADTAEINPGGTGGRVRKISSMGIINTFAGNGTEGFSGDNKVATEAEIDNPSGITLDSSGNLYIGDWNNYRIRKVDATGQIATIAGTGMPCFGAACVLGDGGPAASAQIGSPYGMVTDGKGNLYFVDGTYGCNCVRKIDASGVIHTVAGGGTSVPGDGGPATSAYLAPLAVAFDAIGNLYISDNDPYSSPPSVRIRKVDTAGTITTIAGTGPAGFSGDGGPATSAELSNPSGLAFDSTGNLYIGDGTRVRKVDTNGIISTFAGNGTSGFSGDAGPATSAELTLADGIAVDKVGNVYIADGNNRVRKVDTKSIITTFAGTGTVGFTGDGGPALSAQFSEPGGLAVDANNNLFVGDVFNDRVREIMSTAFTVAANPTSITITSAGGSGTSGLTVAPVPFFTGSVALACTVAFAESGTPNLPPTCSLSVGSLALSAPTNGSATLTVNTTAPQTAMVLPNLHWRMYPRLTACLLFSFIGTFILAGKSRRRGVLLFGMGVLLVAVLPVIGCGAGGSSRPTTPGTTSGTYNVTVTATSGSFSSTTVVQVNVQ